MKKVKNIFGEGNLYDKNDLGNKIYATSAACMSVWSDMLSFANKEKERFIAAGMTGKIKTTTQMIAIPLLILDNWPFSMLSFNLPMDIIFLWIALIMTIVSGAEYIIKNKQCFSM